MMVNNKQWKKESSVPKSYISTRVEELKISCFTVFSAHGNRARLAGVSRKKKTPEVWSVCINI